MSLKEVIDLYNTSATLTGLYWNLFAVVVLGLLGFLFANKSDLRTWHRVLLCMVFIIFAVANISALINKQTMHYAMAHEVVSITKTRPPSSEALQQKLKEVGAFPTAHSLQATRWEVMAAFHVFFDIVVIVTIFVIHPSTRENTKGTVMVNAKQE